MKKKGIIPKVFDNVERADYSKEYGYVKEIVDNDHVIVAWSDNIYPKVVLVKEKITDLALTRRI